MEVITFEKGSGHAHENKREREKKREVYAYNIYIYMAEASHFALLSFNYRPMSNGAAATESVFNTVVLGFVFPRQRLLVQENEDITNILLLLDTAVGTKPPV